MDSYLDELLTSPPAGVDEPDDLVASLLGAFEPPRAASPGPSQPTAAKPAKASAPGELIVGSFNMVVKSKGMWAGALTPVAFDGLMGAVLAADPPVESDSDAETDGESGPAETSAPRLSLIPITRAHTPALLKGIDEIVVNATDHHAKHATSPASKRVTRIDIGLDPTGRVTVENDGPGVPVKRNEEESAAKGRTVYDPEVAFGVFLAGTNIVKAAESVTGGINGLGAKLANAHSVEFAVETVDAASKKRYRQTWRDRMEVVGAPAISAVGATEKPFTRVSFVPAYEALGYPAGSDGSLRPTIHADFDAWLRLRALQAAAYVGPTVKVSYNGERCPTTDVTALGRLIARAAGAEDAPIFPGIAKAAEAPWSAHQIRVAAVVLPSATRGQKNEQHMLIVNGVVTPKGPHLRWIKQALAAVVEEKLQRVTKQKKATKTAKPTRAGAKKAVKASTSAAAAAKTSKAAKSAESATPTGLAVVAGVRFVMCAAIPGADWSGQRKDELQIGKGVMERWTLPAAYLQRVADAVVERILLASRSKADKVIHDKYTPARQIKKAADRPFTLLLAAEGDSAMKFLRTGLTQTRARGARGGPTFDWCGIISLQGVVVNAAREVTEVESQEGKAIQVRSGKLSNNKRLLALADAFGLQYDRTYRTPEDLATLNYGRLILCVDQDLDGTGKIAPLVLVWIYTFWPALFAAKRIGRFVTPLIRVYPKPRPKMGPPIVEFLYEEEFRHWLSEDPSRSAAVGKTLTVKYYKGLAGHNPVDEVSRMFTPTAFANSIYTYTIDDAKEVARLFGVYFGTNAILRRQALATPVSFLSWEEVQALRARKEIPLARVQLDVDTKAYKLEAIKRQIPGAVDGLNPVRRKIVTGAAQRLRKLSDEVKVYQVAGHVADSMHYHHGESISSTLTYLAQSWIGARLYPLFIGDGQFGDRHDSKPGSARYICVRMSPIYRALFPPADEWLLPHVEEDGDRAEPQWFAPVMPLAVLEHNRIVSEGWNHFSHGRDLEATLRVVRAYIAGDPDLVPAGDRLLDGGEISAETVADIERLAATWELPPSRRGRTAEARQYRGEPHSFGDYAWSPEENVLRVTDLPFGVLTDDYLALLTKPGRGGEANPRAELIQEIEDQSTVDTVNLAITLRDGAYDRILAEYGDEEIDPFEDAFLLRASIRPRLNYYRADGGVIEFDRSYLALLLYWAPRRRELYRLRLEREKLLLELRIRQQEEILRYIAIAAELDLASVSDRAAAEVLLRAREFKPLDSGLISAPGYTPNDALLHLITEGPDANFAYLLSLQQGSLVEKKANKRRAEVAAAKAELARIQDLLAERPTPGGSLWLAEIEKFQQVVEQGIKTDWTF